MAREQNMNENNALLRVLELYSGIGGLHYALKDSGLIAEVIAAIDINENANEVYQFNFPSTTLLQRNIHSLRAKDLNELNVDLVWMSPPCQPFTRNGLKKDKMDHRTDSFLHILDILKVIANKPKFILIENVKGFETSETHEIFTQRLIECGYAIKEYLLNPKQFGIPNSRLRYYAVAILSQNCRKHDIHHVLPQSCPSTIRQTTISEFLEDKDDQYFDQYLIPNDILFKYAQAMDIVTASDEHSCCFTKAYGHYATGTGSILRMNEQAKMATAFMNNFENDDEKLMALQNLRLRYFTPREIANIMGFPSSFGFPPYLKQRQCYQLLGNSLNVTIVTKLLQTINDCT